MTLKQGVQGDGIPLASPPKEREAMHWDLRDHVTHQAQMSEAFFLSMILAVSGGFQDAYTYMVRDHVYANAQTGNVVLMSTNLIQGNWATALRYLLPLISFALGVILAEYLHIHFQNRGKLHWRQEVVAVECAIMVAVGFMPQRLNMLANCLVSLACAMQVQSFRTVHGYGYASTMCIGNLRSGMAAVATFISTRERKYIVMARYYFGVILSFAVGAGIGGNLSPVLHERAIWTCAALLLFSFWLMNWKGRMEQK